MAQPRLVERAKLFFFRNFERIFVLLLVFAIVAIHALVEQKFAFLSFYYLPLILAGFYGGGRFAGLGGVFVAGAGVVFPHQAGAPHAARGFARRRRRPGPAAGGSCLTRPPWG